MRLTGNLQAALLGGDVSSSQGVSERIVGITNVDTHAVLSAEIVSSAMEVVSERHNTGGFTLNVNKCTAVSGENLPTVILRAITLVDRHSVSLMGRPLSEQESSCLDKSAVAQFFNTCEVEFVRGNAEERARLDAQDFIFPQEDLMHDGESLRRLGTIEEVVRERQFHSQNDRFNSIRYQTYLADTSDAPVLCGLAGLGATIPVASDFVINPIVEPPRQLQRKLGKCYCKHAHKLWKSGGALVFREEDVPISEREKLNVNPLHWCPKPFCDCGRWLGDLSNRLEGCSINSPESKEMARQLYGDMTYPLIGDIITSWLEYATKYKYELSELRIWKEDIRSAFAQFNIAPKDTYKLAFSFAEGLLLIMIWGFFGWTGAPLVFANFSRAMLEVLARVALGVIFLFCDDFIGCGHHSIAMVDQQAARVLIDNVFGPGKVALEKSVLPSLQAEVLGWWIDLENGSIRPSDKGIRKLMFVFFSVDNTASHWSLEMCQVLASLAQRYSQALMGMRPFVQPFHQLCSGPPSKWRCVSGKARFAVEMWRACLILLFINKESMSVSLRVMVGSPLGFEVFDLLTDGSYLGVGTLILDDERSLSQCPFSDYIFKFLQNREEAIKPKYQNHREFSGLVVGIVMLVRTVKIPLHGAVIRWVNDNTAALEWCRKDMCKGKCSQILFMFYSALLIKYKLHVIQVEHTAGLSDLMKPVDALSRGLPTPELDEHLRVDLSNIEALDELMCLCNPTITQTVDSYHETFELIQSIITRLTD